MSRARRARELADAEERLRQIRRDIYNIYRRIGAPVAELQREIDELKGRIGSIEDQFIVTPPAPAPTGGEPATIVIVRDASGMSTWDISYQIEELVWRDVALPDNVTHERPQPICLTESLWFVANVGGFPRPVSKFAGGTECNRQMARTKDGGVTWDSILIGDETCTSDRSAAGDETNHFSRICRAIDGRLGNE